MQLTLKANLSTLKRGMAGEFNSGHLPSAINIPLDVLEAAMPVRLPDRNQVLLLHCQSGMRSGVAVKKLRSLDYTNTFNLGSLSRARAVVDDVEGE